jgi:hypothetical protein
MQAAAAAVEEAVPLEHPVVDAQLQQDDEAGLSGPQPEEGQQGAHHLAAVDAQVEVQEEDLGTERDAFAGRVQMGGAWVPVESLGSLASRLRFLEVPCAR